MEGAHRLSIRRPEAEMGAARGSDGARLRRDCELDAVRTLRAEAMVAWKELLASAPQYNLSVAYTSASLLFSQVDDPKRGYGARKERSRSINAIMAPRRSPPDAALRSRAGAGSPLWSC